MDIKKIDYHPYEVLYNEFIQAIQKTRGIDPRTVEKWIKTFETHRLIEIETRGSSKIVKVLYGNPG